MKYRYLILFLFCLSAKISLQAQFRISGYLQDSASGERLINAAVTELGTSNTAITNNYGFFNISLPGDSAKLRFSFTGYNEQILSVNKNTALPLQLNLSSMKWIKGVTIVSKGNAPVNSTQMSEVSIPISQIKNLPRFFGENDILKALQLMPGIKGGVEGSSGIYVRGGGPDQNLILLDGTPLYNVSHLFGFFSVFNTDAINNVSVLKGGFPARYGGRLSSVIDITMKEGNMKKFKVEGAIGILASKITIEGPIIKDRLSFLVSGRRTYLDVLMNPITAAINGPGMKTSSGYFFYDLNGKINYKINKTNRIYLSYYSGLDKFYLKNKPYSYIWNGEVIKTESEEGQKWGNRLMAARWNKVIDNKIFINTSVTFTKYLFDIYQNSNSNKESDTGVIHSEFRNRFFSGIRDLSLKSEMEFTKRRHNMRMGINVIRHEFSPGSNYVYFKESGSETVDTTFGNQMVRSLEAAAYAEDDIELSGKFKMNYGLHLNMYNYRSTNYFSLQPRLAMRYLLSPSFSLKGSYSRMRQNIHLLANNSLGLPTDLWVPATDRVKPMTADQIAIGLVKNLSRMFEFTFETYYKSMRNVLEYKEGASYLSQLNSWENKVLQGKGWSYGGEVLLQKKLGVVTGWIGYTLSWAQRNVPGVNNNKTFFYKYDSRHDFSFVLNYKDGTKWDYGFVWVFRTGNAITLPTAAYPGVNPFPTWNSKPVAYGYSSRNNFRYADYHRFDFSVTRHYMKRWGQIDVNFSIYNVYSRINPFYYRIGVDNQGNKQVMRVGLFPIIPSLSMSFKF